MRSASKNIRPEFDELIVKIVDYVFDSPIQSQEALETAGLVLLDSLACALRALEHPACTNLLGPTIPKTLVEHGVRVPGTSYCLDPMKAAFDIGTCIRWLDYNDTFLGLEWGHPSDNLGGILAVADYIAQQQRLSNGSAVLSMHDVLIATIKAHEIQGIIALENAFNRVGLDHVVLVKVATSAVVSQLLNLTKTEALNAVSNAWIDGQALRIYRQAPNTGSRKSWAAGDATRRGVQLAWLAKQGEMGYRSALSAPKWGFQDASFRGKPVVNTKAFGSYVMERVLFKVLYPAEFHGQTAVECAIQLHEKVINHLDNIQIIELETQQPAMRIINKTGPLYNEADRDHSLQYMVAIGLIYGHLHSEDYSNKIAKNPQIDELRHKMVVQENPQFTEDYYHEHKRAISNSLQVFFRNGTSSERIQIDYPIGHRHRRQEAIPLLKEKYCAAIVMHFEGEQADRLMMLWEDFDKKAKDIPVCDFMSLFVSER